MSNNKFSFQDNILWLLNAPVRYLKSSKNFATDILVVFHNRTHSLLWRKQKKNDKSFQAKINVKNTRHLNFFFASVFSNCPFLGLQLYYENNGIL